MKRVVVILFFGVGNAIAQNISPMELKEARLAMYEWFDKYQSYNIFAPEASERQYRSLFADTAVVVNDYLPYKDYNFDNPSVPLHSYIDLAKSNRDGFYSCYSKIIGVDVVSEILVGRTFKYEFDFEKVVWFKDTANYHYEYPKDTLKYRVDIEYDIVSQKAKATSIRLNKPIDRFVVLHQDVNNTYTTLQHLEEDSALLSNRNVPMVNYKYNSCIFDSKIYELQCDTIKWAFYLNGSVGNGFLGTVENNLYSDIRQKSRFGYSFGIGLYRQLKLSGDNRLGLEFGLLYRQTNLNMNNIYGDRYASVDADGGSYERIVAVANYNENLERYAVGVPVALRYDHFMMAGQRKRLAVSVKLGVLPTRDFKQVSTATGNAQYSGYYDWLWGVTIDQNDVYDFGNYDIGNQTNNTAIDKFSLDAYAVFGFSYYVTRRVSIDLSAVYFGTLYNSVKHTENYHLTNDRNDWHSVSWMMKKYSLHSIDFMLQMNYNF